MRRYNNAARRSKFEDKLEAYFIHLGIKYKYEPKIFPLLKTVVRGVCSECGSKKVFRSSTYKPDFYLPDFDIWVEAKGKLTTINRTTYKKFKEQYPEIDLRFLFMRNNPITKGSRTTYMMWAIKHGFKAAVNKNGEMPSQWIQ